MTPQELIKLAFENMHIETLPDDRLVVLTTGEDLVLGKTGDVVAKLEAEDELLADFEAFATMGLISDRLVETFTTTVAAYLDGEMPVLDEVVEATEDPDNPFAVALQEALNAERVQESEDAAEGAAEEIPEQLLSMDAEPDVPQSIDGVTLPDSSSKPDTEAIVELASEAESAEPPPPDDPTVDDPDALPLEQVLRAFAGLAQPEAELPPAVRERIAFYLTIEGGTEFAQLAADVINLQAGLLREAVSQFGKVEAVNVTALAEQLDSLSTRLDKLAQAAIQLKEWDPRAAEQARENSIQLEKQLKATGEQLARAELQETRNRNLQRQYRNFIVPRLLEDKRVHLWAYVRGQRVAAQEARNKQFAEETTHVMESIGKKSPEIIRAMIDTLPMEFQGAVREAADRHYDWQAASAERYLASIGEALLNGETVTAEEVRNGSRITGRGTEVVVRAFDNVTGYAVLANQLCLVDKRGREVQRLVFYARDGKPRAKHEAARNRDHSRVSSLTMRTGSDHPTA
jgi:hypothetical protein